MAELNLSELDLATSRELTDAELEAVSGGKEPQRPGPRPRPRPR